MSYTNQEVGWEAHGAQDAYGDMAYKAPKTIKARKQPKQEIVKMADGKELLSQSYYYVDPKVEREALNIGSMDKLDGELIISRYAMCDKANKVKMVRFITV